MIPALKEKQTFPIFLQFVTTPFSLSHDHPPRRLSVSVGVCIYYIYLFV